MSAHSHETAFEGNARLPGAETQMAESARPDSGAQSLAQQVKHPTELRTVEAAHAPELQATNEALQATIKELQAQQQKHAAELQAKNEALEAKSDALLATSKELLAKSDELLALQQKHAAELQAKNDALQAKNDALHAKSEELQAKHDEVKDLRRRLQIHEQLAHRPQQLTQTPPGLLSDLKTKVSEIWTLLKPMEAMDTNAKENLSIVQVISTPRAGKSLLLDEIYNQTPEGAVKPIRITYNHTTPWGPSESTAAAALLRFKVRIILSVYSSACTVDSACAVDTDSHWKECLQSNRRNCSEELPTVILADEFSVLLTHFEPDQLTEFASSMKSLMSQYSLKLVYTGFSEVACGRYLRISGMPAAVCHLVSGDPALAEPYLAYVLARQFVDSADPTVPRVIWEVCKRSIGLMGHLALVLPSPMPKTFDECLVQMDLSTTWVKHLRNNATECFQLILKYMQHDPDPSLIETMIERTLLYPENMASTKFASSNDVDRAPPRRENFYPCCFAFAVVIRTLFAREAAIDHVQVGTPFRKPPTRATFAKAPTSNTPARTFAASTPSRLPEAELTVLHLLNDALACCGDAEASFVHTNHDGKPFEKFVFFALRIQSLCLQRTISEAFATPESVLHKAFHKKRGHITIDFYMWTVVGRDQLRCMLGDALYHLFPIGIPDHVTKAVSHVTGMKSPTQNSVEIAREAFTLVWKNSKEMKTERVFRFVADGLTQVDAPAFRHERVNTPFVPLNDINTFPVWKSSNTLESDFGSLLRELDNDHPCIFTPLDESNAGCDLVVVIPIPGSGERQVVVMLIELKDCRSASTSGVTNKIGLVTDENSTKLYFALSRALNKKRPTKLSVCFVIAGLFEGTLEYTSTPPLPEETDDSAAPA